MSKISNLLITILKIVVFVLIAILLISTVIFEITQKNQTDNVLTKLFWLEIWGIIGGSICIFSKINIKCKVIILLTISLILRLFWIFSINTLPISDFDTMYNSASNILTGDFSVLKGYSYLARFPHLISTTLYIASIMKIFGQNTLPILKVLNVLFGVLSVYLLYKLSDNFIENEKIKLFTVLIGAIFPAFMTYTSVLCTENLAIPLYLLTLIFFLNAKKNETWEIFFVSGVLLALSNLFRRVGIVFLIAFLIYLLLCESKKKYTNIICVVSGYIIFALSISGILLAFNVIERPLWNGAEPSYATLLLKGTNFDHNGQWNVEDAEFVTEHLQDDNLVELCFYKVKERILSKKIGEIFAFYARKFISQWMCGDCSGTYWAYLGANVHLPMSVPLFFQYTYTFILLLSLVGILKKGNNALICIILFGFMLLFTIIEMQSRYSFIVSFVFIILAVQGIEVIVNFIQEGNKNGWKNKKSFREYFFK